MTSIKKWHYGKIVLLWGWGGFILVFLISAYMATKPDDKPIAHLCEALVMLVILFALSCITWIWLGGKESGT
jgi:hypothetical protein